MKGSPFKKLLVLILFLGIVAALVLQFFNARVKPIPKTLLPDTSEPEFEYHYQSPSPGSVAKTAGPEESVSDGREQLKISRDKAEAWLAKHHRNATSLLAVFRALNDTNYLNEAAKNFPNDPRVQLSVLSSDVSSEDRRKWLEAFKASSPNNSLANYLSAVDYFKNGRPDAALQELLAASDKGQIKNYAIETLLDGEELYSDSGVSPVLTSSYAMADMTEQNLPQLRDFKILSQGVSEAMKQKSAAGDAASVANLAMAGLALSGKMDSGDSGKFLINQLVATASERIILAQLDQNNAYDFLNNQTPAQVVETLKQQKTDLRQLVADFGPAQKQMMMSDAEMASYMQRLAIYGEIEAMKWAIQQHPPSDSQK